MRDKVRRIFGKKKIMYTLAKFQCSLPVFFLSLSLCVYGKLKLHVCLTFFLFCFCFYFMVLLLFYFGINELQHLYILVVRRKKKKAYYATNELDECSPNKQQLKESKFCMRARVHYTILCIHIVYAIISIRND